MPYNRQIPDAPIALSMLPRAAAADLKKNDLLYLVQPGNNTGGKSKSLTLETLADSDVFRLQGVRNAITKSNILDFTGALAETSASSFTEVCHLDVNPLMDVEFHVWGTSGSAGDSGDTYSSYQYGLRGKTRQYYAPDDHDRELLAYSYAGFRDQDENGPTAPCYNAVFGLTPYDYTGDLVSAYQTKRVTLYLSSGTTMNPYHATPPASFTLKIQALIYPSKYVSDVLKATTP